MATENQAPEGGPALALEALMQIKATLVLENEKGAQSAIVDTIWHGPGETLFDYIDNSIAALAAQPKATPMALPVDAITRCWGQSEGTQHGYAPFAYAVIDEFCRINGIPAPQTKEPTNDR